MKSFQAVTSLAKSSEEGLVYVPQWIEKSQHLYSSIKKNVYFGVHSVWLQTFK
jgi:hypothetical protein